MSSEVKYRPIMVVGSGSHVGKSVLTAGLCRVFKRRGVDVAPFKAQNMALNSGITPDGLEMGRAQISQAEAAGLEPHVDMNPILLKPTSDVGSQVVLLGKVMGNFQGKNYYKLKPQLVEHVMEAYGRLSGRHELVIMEGAGSCAEMNLKEHDLVNMSMAERAKAKVILCSDIDAGGVFAQLIGSLDLLSNEERELICGLVVNKFRGDPDLFDSGIEFIEQRTGKPVLGLVPHFAGRITLPQEDGVALERGELGGGEGGAVRVGVVQLSHISNYTDADALDAEDAVELTWVERTEQLAGLDLLILPGTKNTLAALRGLRASGLDRAIAAYHAIGGKVLGLCGGYQLLGRNIEDPLGVEGPKGGDQGLGLLDIATVMAGDKTTTRATADCLDGLPFGCEGSMSGYEIHMGQSRALGPDRPAFMLRTRSGEPVKVAEGQVSEDGRVVGTYLHGILDNDSLRAAVLAWAAGREQSQALESYAAFKDQQYDLLADLLEEHLDLSGLLEPAAE